MAKNKIRLDELLILKGLASDTDRASRLIMAGEVWRGTERLTQPGRKFPRETAIELRRPDTDVSRGAKKLRGALSRFSVTATGRVAVDLGASTGGFTQVLLEAGCRRVYAFDVGSGLLDASLRGSDSVLVREGRNVKEWQADWVDEPFSLVVGDLSFIGLRLVLPRVLASARKDVDADAVVLMKPQFEATSAEASRGGGVVNDPAIHERLLGSFREWVPEAGWRWVADIPAAVRGGRGNQEYLIHYRREA